MADDKFAENPWSAEHWNLTRQGAYVRKHGIEVAKTKARQAGTSLAAGKPKHAHHNAVHHHHHHILQRRVNAPIAHSGGSTGNAPQGYDGIGPPDTDL